MTRFLFLFLICLAAFPCFAQDKKSIQEYSACMKTATSTMAMRACYKIKSDAYDTKITEALNRIYHSSKISDAYKNDTRQTQENWLLYARHQAALVCPSADPAECGTISQLNAAQAFIDKQDQRSKEIARQIIALKPYLDPVAPTPK